MGRRRSATRKKTSGKLNILVKLEYGEDYQDLWYLFLLVTLVAAAFTGGLALILLPLSFFYLAAIQLYSGIGLSISRPMLGWNWSYKMVALYKKEQQPGMFFLNVATCIFMGVILSLAGLGMFLSIR